MRTKDILIMSSRQKRSSLSRDISKLYEDNS